MFKEELNLQKHKSLRYIIPFFIGNGFIYGLNALYYSFMPIYLENVCGKNEFERGIILSAGPLVAIIALIFWGAMSDKAKYKNNILILLVIISAIIYSCISFNNSFVYLIIIFSLLMFFMSPFAGLIDTISLEYSNVTGIAYGPMRNTGSIVFGLLSLFLAFLTQINLNIVFVVFIIMALVAVVSLVMTPQIKGYAHGKNKLNLKEFFKDKVIIILFIAHFIGQFIFGCYNTFMPNFLTTQLEQPQWVWGMATLFCIIGELVFFAKFNLFFSIFGVKTLLIFSIIISFMRGISFAFLPHPAIILTTNLLTGWFSAVVNYCVAYYISNTVKKEMQASGQTLLYSLTFYIPRFLASFFGGYIVSLTSFSILMGICAILSGMLLIFLFFNAKKIPNHLTTR